MHLRQHLNFWWKYFFSQPLQRSIKITIDEESRLQNYLRLESFEVPQDKLVSVNSIPPHKKTYYSYDWYRIFSSSDTRQCFYAFGDISTNLDYPGLTKSRPISPTSNNVLLPLETARHFDFITDNLTLESKFNAAVWRGAAYQAHRKEFLTATENSKFGNFSDTSDITKNGGRKSTNFLSVRDQLKYKFIVSLEGNDVASNLKWIMASNSVAVMPKPKMETWFSERTLVANQHYVEISDDYSDIDEKIEYFLGHPNELKEINAEAKKYCQPFFDLERQYQLGMVIADRYFDLVKPY